MTKQRAFALLGPMLILSGCLVTAAAMLSGWSDLAPSQADHRSMTAALDDGALAHEISREVY
jgi:alpha-beta hydrolase superfamily lysophospholipase